MEDLRSEIRAAFEKEQAANPPDMSLRRSVVQAVTAQQPRRETNLQWVAVAVAALLAIVIVGALMSAKLSQRASVPVHPQATPSGTPFTLDRDYGLPPADVPLFYVQSPTHPGWYIGFNWNGVPEGTIKLAQPLASNSGLAQAPDGSVFQVTLGGKGGGGYLDRLGQPIPGASMPMAKWADDSSHLCEVFVAGQMWTLGTQAVGQSVRTVATIMRFQNDESEISLVTCSFKNGRAVLLRSAAGGPTDLWVIQLLDGKVLSHTPYTTGTALGSVIGSGDASLIAENSSKSQGFIGGPTAPQTTVRRPLDGSVVATLDPSFEVLAFSADNSEALVATTPWASGTPTHVALIDLATGKVLWRRNENAELAGVFTEPVGAAFALLFQSPSETGPHPTVYIVMVPVDGRDFAIPGQYIRP